MATYRYKRRLDQTRLQRMVPGAPTFSAASPMYVDVVVGTSSKADLDEIMARDGFEFVSTDPSTTPTEQASADMGTDIRDVVLFDHFITGNLDLDELGWSGWRTGVVGTGSDIGATPEAGHPGVIDFGAGTVAGGRAAMFLGEPTVPNWILNTTQNQIDCEWLVKFNANALASANNERWTCGFGDGFDVAAGAQHTNGIYVEFDPATSANFLLVIMNATNRTAVATSIVVDANTWYRVMLRLTYPGGVPTVQLLVNGTVRATSTATFPSAGLGLGVRMDANATVNEPRFQTDYVLVRQVTAKET